MQQLKLKYAILCLAKYYVIQEVLCHEIKTSDSIPAGERIYYIDEPFEYRGEKWFSHTVHNSEGRAKRKIIQYLKQDLIRDKKFTYINWLKSIAGVQKVKLVIKSITLG